MRSAPLAKAVAVTLAVLAHVALAALLVDTRPPQPEIAGTGGLAEVRLGAPFASVAAGTLAPQTPTTAPSARAKAAPRAPQAPAIAARRADTPLMPETARAAPQRAKPTAIAKSSRPPPTRPAPRPRNTQEKQGHKGQSKTSERAGDASGRQQAKARQSGTGSTPKTAGTAAKSAYPGAVMRRLAQAGKPRIAARGAAVIAFTVAPSGALAGLSLAKSSGSVGLDRAALALVQRAAPFPRPPTGARRSFSVEIRGE